MAARSRRRVRRLALVLGDQLDRDAPIFQGLDPERDALWMAEADEEASYVPAHRRRLVLFFSAMRHFRDALREKGWTVHYTELAASAAKDRGPDLASILGQDLERLGPESVVVTWPGDHRVLEALRGAVSKAGLELEVLEDTHFLCPLPEFDAWAEGRKELVLETFYRNLRKRDGILLENGKPVGGKWNYDEENRDSFGKQGPGRMRRPRRFQPDETTEAVMRLVGRRFADHPGHFEDFDLPVTRSQARAALRDFVAHRLERFGTYEDAIWLGEPFLYHSRLSAALNLKLLHPRECIDAALEAHREKRAPIAAVEGFVRQILGWREFVRGVYWHFMPEYAERNALEADEELPSFYWDGETDMACVADAMRSVLDHGYAHHIQRLMVLGLFAQLYGAHPYRFHEWHMALYLDAVDWVSLPNTLGMSQWGDGGVIGTKPYCASGAYISRMSNACGECRYRPKEAVGDDACPFTTLYWDFLARHHERFRGNRRMAMQLRNVERKKPAELKAIRERADQLRASLRPA